MFICGCLDVYTLIPDFHHPAKAPELREDSIDRYCIHVTEPFDNHLRRSQRNADNEIRRLSVILIISPGKVPIRRVGGVCPE